MHQNKSKVQPSKNSTPPDLNRLQVNNGARRTQDSNGALTTENLNLLTDQAFMEDLEKHNDLIFDDQRLNIKQSPAFKNSILSSNSN